MKNLDKIAFLAAILIVIGGAAVVMLGGSEDEVASIKAALDKITASTREQEIAEVVVPDRRAEVEALHTLGEGGDFSGWSFYRQPGVVLWQPAEEVREPEHGMPCVVEIKVVRDEEKREPGLNVVVRPGKLVEATFESVTVEARPRDAEDDAAWQPVGKVDRPGSSDAIVRVTDLSVGVPHEFRVRSKAVVHPGTNGRGAGFVPERVCDSVGGEYTFIPYDEFWHCSGITMASVIGGNLTLGTATINLRYWDYDEGEVKRHKKSGRYVEPEDPAEWEKGKPVCDTTWYLYRVIERGKGKDMVTVAALRTTASREKKDLTKGEFKKEWINPPDTPGNCPEIEDPDGDEADGETGMDDDDDGGGGDTGVFDD